MFKRHSTLTSMFDEPEMFGILPIDSKNDWVRLGMIILWAEFEFRY